MTYITILAILLSVASFAVSVMVLMYADAAFDQARWAKRRLNDHLITYHRSEHQNCRCYQPDVQSDPCDDVN